MSPSVCGRPPLPLLVRLINTGIVLIGTSFWGLHRPRGDLPPWSSDYETISKSSSSGRPRLQCLCASYVSAWVPHYCAVVRIAARQPDSRRNYEMLDLLLAACADSAVRLWLYANDIVRSSRVASWCDERLSVKDLCWSSAVIHDYKLLFCVRIFPICYQMWRMGSSVMSRRVTLVRTDVSKELSASFMRVTIIGELGTTLAVTSNRRTSNLTLK
jgi:hypothetical protein